MFKDIEIIDKWGESLLTKPLRTIGWYFKYKGNEYGDTVNDQVPTGRKIEYIGYDDDDKSFKYMGEEYETIKLTEKHQIALVKTMLKTMKGLVKK